MSENFINERKAEVIALAHAISKTIPRGPDGKIDLVVSALACAEVTASLLQTAAASKSAAAAANLADGVRLIVTAGAEPAKRMSPSDPKMVALLLRRFLDVAVVDGQTDVKAVVVAGCSLVESALRQMSTAGRPGLEDARNGAQIAANVFDWLRRELAVTQPAEVKP